ncbi:class I SAM-dependent methyltransferase [Paludibaculum fermentans]|uniref:class I SAM-dependent methyltransferase n=1 Tax=Paludibaculum fermentans TaxID=1473598 RepID=UPI003EBCE045
MRISFVYLFIAASGLLAAQTHRNPAARWDQIYLSPDAKVPVNPSTLVLETTASLKPGSALDVGMGNGRNSIYLARKGWKVTGIDISPAAVKQASQEAAKLKVEFDARAGDIERMDLGRDKYDLILCMYVHMVPIKNARKLIDSLKPGGLLIVEGHHADVQSLGLRPVSGGPPGYMTNQLVRAFERLRILRYEDRTMQAEWSNGPEGKAPIVRLVARKE